MSARDKLREWLDENGVPYTEKNVTDAWGDLVENAIRIDAPKSWNGEEDRHDGYAGFFILAVFDEAGELKKIGAWE